MTSAILTDLLRAKPFCPFRIVISHAIEFYVSDPAKVRHENGSRYVVVVDEEMGRELIIDLGQVVLIEVRKPKRGSSA